jgi:hypothetical protein
MSRRQIKKIYQKSHKKLPSYELLECDVATIKLWPKIWSMETFSFVTIKVCKNTLISVSRPIFTHHMSFQMWRMGLSLKNDFFIV